MRTFSRILLVSLLISLFPYPGAYAAGDGEAAAVKPALLVMDIQEVYLEPVSQRDRDMALKAVNMSMDIFRHYGFPVILVYHKSPYWKAVPGAKGFEYPASVKIEPSDPRIIKARGSAFAETDLEKILKEKGINTLFICGLSSTGCVMATYFAAVERNYTAFTIADALLCHKDHLKHAAVEILGGLPLNALHFMVRNAARQAP